MDFAHFLISLFENAYNEQNEIAINTRNQSRIHLLQGYLALSLAQTWYNYDHEASHEIREMR